LSSAWRSFELREPSAIVDRWPFRHGDAGSPIRRPQGTEEAFRFKTPPEFGAVPATTGPVCVERHQICVERALPHAEDIISIATKHLADRAALTQPWSNGQAEGQITKLKLVKRQMYGRAKIDLLQARLIGAV
jgi:hypothetical protein